MVRTDWFSIFKQLALNSVFWVGIAALFLSVLSALPAPSDASDGIQSGQVSQDPFFFVILFAGMIVFNLALLFALKSIAPQLFRQFLLSRGDGGFGEFGEGETEGQVGFRIYPLAYPKVLDEDLRDYAPEFVHLDVLKGRRIVFGGNIARDALKNFRDMLSTVLLIKEVQPAPKPEKKATATKADATKA